MLLTAGVAAVREPAVAEALMTPLERLAEAVPPLANRPRIVAAALGSAALAATLLWRCGKEHAWRCWCWWQCLP